MRDTVQRLLSQARPSILVSLYDQTIIAANRAVRELIPGMVEDARIDGVVTAWAEGRGVEVPLGDLLGVLRQPGVIESHWWPNGDSSTSGAWFVAGKLPPIEGYPPTALVTIHFGNSNEITQLGAADMHASISFAVTAAIELDQVSADLAGGMQMMMTTQERVFRLSDTLVGYVRALSGETDRRRRVSSPEMLVVGLRGLTDSRTKPH